MQVILATANTNLAQRLTAYVQHHSIAVASLLGEDLDLRLADHSDGIATISQGCKNLRLIMFDVAPDNAQEAADSEGDSPHPSGFGRAGLTRAFTLANAYSRTKSRKKPKTGVVVMGHATSTPEMREAIALGAVGYIPLDATPTGFLAALMLMLEGNIFIPATSQSGDTNKPTIKLTRRERDVLQCLVAGHSDKKIAKIYNIAVVTVKHHLKGLRAKLGAKNRVHALVRAIELGLVARFTLADPH